MTTSTAKSDFKDAQDCMEERMDDFVIGTITASEKVHYVSAVSPPCKAPTSFDVIHLELDRPVNGVLNTKAITHIKESCNPLGRRLRGKLFSSAEQMTEIKQMASEYNDAYERQYDFMKNDGAVFFDHRTLHIAADDAMVLVSNDATRSLSDLGLKASGGDDYYIIRGIQCGALLQEPGLPDAPKPVLYNGTPYRVSL